MKQEFTYLSDRLDGYVEEEQVSYGRVYNCYFDGACFPTNPDGKIGWGFHIGKKLAMCGFHKERKGNTNNLAEYLALYHLLRHLEDKVNVIVNIYGDSKLVVNQVNGHWKIKEGSYVSTAIKTKELFDKIKQNIDIKLKWIPREENKSADRLSTLINMI